ncbi:MAG: CRISPR-associated protein Cas1 [Candidatus Carbobacillus altaicus]|uniref:CRISPR-associated endonuclease Cas1 n=1 Tax=Candidatus Carbonibacillus altaicus TaxID=2163959 RepID=A0A2R6Y2E9_9BACL|nr:MAG: CRISPR-associated protein Cas1 [Candidatus Carbobacillus altaicus]
MKKSLYFFQNGMLRRKENSLYFEGESMKRFFPVEDINDIFIFGEVEVNKKLLEFISQKNIILHFFNHYGYYTGSYYPREHLNAGLVILKQAEHYLNPDQRLLLAKKFVTGSIAQMSRVLKYYRNRVKENAEHIAQSIEGLEENIKKVKGIQTIDELLAIEGHSRENYYTNFDVIIQNQDFPFEKRSARPPLNRLNAMISFGNTILYTTALSEIYKTFLDPRIGYLHSTNYRRFTLNLDVAEIFKPILVDRTIFSLINKRKIQKKDFAKQMEGILLNQEGQKKFIQELDERMKTTVEHRHLGKSVSYRRLIRLELYKLQKHFLGEKEYEPYKSLW